MFVLPERVIGIEGDGGDAGHFLTRHVRPNIQVLDFTPAKAGAHLEISGWAPAFAGVTACGYYD
ncbi:hypothetical protein D3C86_2189550 [compost metagenome]